MVVDGIQGWDFGERVDSPVEHDVSKSMPELLPDD